MKTIGENYYYFFFTGQFSGGGKGGEKMKNAEQMFFGKKQNHLKIVKFLAPGQKPIRIYKIRKRPNMFQSLLIVNRKKINPPQSGGDFRKDIPLPE